jgi:hypothetical protein
MNSTVQTVIGNRLRSAKNIDRGRFIKRLTDPLSGAQLTDPELHFIHDRVRSNGLLEVSRDGANSLAAVDDVRQREQARRRPRCDI